MSEIVFILGAGASKEAGAPLMREFLTRAEDVRRNPRSQIDRDAFELVFQAISRLQSVHSKARLDLDNLEDVFGAFEMARAIGVFPGYEHSDIEKLTSSFRRVIADTLEESVEFRVKDQQILPSRSYGKLAQLVGEISRGSPRRTCSIITFNYDVALDYAFQVWGVPITCALEGAGPDIPIPYLKLHGSLNWVRTKETDGVISWPASQWSMRLPPLPEEGKVARFRPSRRLRTEHPEFAREDYDSDPVIVPPTWNKTVYHPNVAKVWHRAATELSDAENIYVSGYSLIGTDTYFRYLFALGAVGASRIRRFVVVDPDETEQFRRRFRGILGPDVEQKLVFNGGRFDQMLSIANGHLLPDQPII